MIGQGNAIPLQAVEPNVIEYVFEPNVIKGINNEILFAYIEFYIYYC